MGGHLYDYHLYEWSSACDYWCMSSYLYVRKSEYVLDIQSVFFLFFFHHSNIILIVFF